MCYNAYQRYLGGFIMTINIDLVTKYDLKSMKTELVKCVAGMLIAQVAIVAILVKLV